MKSEQEIADRLAHLRKELKSVEGGRKDYAKKTGVKRTNLSARRKRLLEGECTGLAWVLGVPDVPGPTPSVQ